MVCVANCEAMHSSFNGSAIHGKFCEAEMTVNAYIPIHAQRQCNCNCMRAQHYWCRQVLHMLHATKACKAACEITTCPVHNKTVHYILCCNSTSPHTQQQLRSPWVRPQQSQTCCIPIKPHTAAVEVTVIRSTARLAEASPPMIPLIRYTAGTLSVGTCSTRSRYLPNVHRQVVRQNS